MAGKMGPIHKRQMDTQSIPDIRWRLGITLELDQYITQYLTGHGNFTAKLHLLSLKGSPNCSCGGGNDDPEHAIYYCSKWNEQRTKLLTANCTSSRKHIMAMRPGSIYKNEKGVQRLEKICKRDTRNQRRRRNINKDYN